MAKHLFLLIAILFVMVIIFAARSEPATAVLQPATSKNIPSSVDLELVNSRLAAAFNAKPDSVAASPLPGFLEVTFGSELFYVSEDGSHLINGEVFDLVSLDNLTEERRAVDRKKILAMIPEETMIVYRAPDEKYLLSVFTDIDCVYCRKLHQEMAQINALGITVRYLAYPRAGLNSPSYDKAVSVWCSANPHRAMDEAKGSGKIEAMKCDAPVAAHMQLARALGVNSTPSLLLSNGRLQPGYAPAEQLLALFR
ncbi:MAG: DsbC family protein [Chromatiales bacterium]|nr:DsbC family protein [Chromatiales bacterium]